MLFRIIVAIVALIAAFVVPVSPAAQAAGLPARMSITVSPAGAVPAGTDLTVTVRVAGYYAMVPAEGEVTLAVDGVTGDAVELDEGVAEFAIAGAQVLPGALALVAAYGGDANHDAGTVEEGVLVSFVDYPPMVGDQIAPFYADIRWMTAQRITAGYSDNGYHPTAAVSRQAMAAFLYRAAHPGATAPLCAAAPFSDVPSNNPFCGEISWLAQQGISTGYSDGTFRPLAAVSRGAMAQFLYRFRVGGTAPTCTSAPFGDVPTTDAACGAIRWLVGKGVTNGYSDGTFRTTAAVSRQAMAAFLHRLFGDAIRTLKPGAVELDPDDVIEVNYFGAVRVKPGTTLPPVGTILVISTVVNDGNGVFGRITAIDTDENGDTWVTLDTAIALDDAYSQLHIVSTMLSLPPPVPSGGGMSASAARSGALECDAPADAVSIDLTKLAISSFELDLGLHAPRMSIAISYDPSVSVSVSNDITVSCQLSLDVIPAIVIPTPPIVISLGISGTLSFSAGAAATATAGIHIGAGLHADGADTRGNVNVDPFAELDFDAPSLRVQASVGVDVQATLAGVVGLSGSLGMGAVLQWATDGLRRECLSATVTPIASLDAVIDVFVHEFTATLIGSNFDPIVVWKHCYGGGIWSGTASENIVGTGTWPTSNGAWISTDHVDFSRSYVLAHGQSSATISGSFSSTIHYNFAGVTCNDSKQTYTPTTVTDNEGFDFYSGGYEGGGFWPRVGQYTFTGTRTTEHTNPSCQGTSGMYGGMPSMTPKAIFWGPLDTGTVYPLSCSPVDYFPGNVQAIKITVTITCSSTDSNRPATVTENLTYDLVQDECDFRVDSDGDGVGDCAEYYGGGQPNIAD